LSEEFRHILRIRGTDIEGSDSILHGLTAIKGVGDNLSSALIHTLSLDPARQVGTLSDDDIQRIEEALDDPKEQGVPSWYLNRQKDRETGEDLHDTGPDLDLRIRSDIDRLQKIRCWRGVRHMLGLKVRGQRTRTTGRTGRSVGVRRRLLQEEERLRSRT